MNARTAHVVVCMKSSEQMELGLNGLGDSRSPRRQGRASRGQWWFERMRRIVASATDWEPAPPARPEQTYLVKNGR